MPTFSIKPITKKSKKQEVADEILLQAVVKYKELQAKLVFNAEQIRKEMEAPRRIIESAASAAPDGKIVTEHFKVSYTECHSEKFDKVAAIKVLGRKKLAPFLTQTTYMQLRVS